MTNGKKALIIVDMQNDFITGSLGSSDAVVAEERMVEYLKTLDEKTLILFTRDTHGNDYLSTQEGMKLPVPHCVHDTEGWKISNKLLDVLKDKTNYTNTYNKKTFGMVGIPYELIPKSEYRINEITLVGVCTDICVVSNALILKARFPETIIKVIEPLCAGTSKEAHDAAIKVMESCQIEIVREV